MRLLLLSDAYPPLIGGATRAAQQIATAMAARGDDVEVMTMWQPGLPMHEHDGPVAVHRLRSLTQRVPGLSTDHYQASPPPYPDPELTWRMRRIITRFDPDLIHSYGWLSYSLAVALVGRNTPVLLSARDYAYFCSLRTLVRNGRPCDGPGMAKCLACASTHYGIVKGTTAATSVAGGRFLLRRIASGLHSNSSYVQQNVDLHLFRDQPPNPDQVVPSWRDDSDPSTAPNSSILDRLPDTPFILYVGALRVVKGLRQLFDAYAALDGPPPLVLIGTQAPDTPPIPDSVLVLTDVPYQTVLACWDRALFGVFPSLWPEPLGKVVHEAMSRGKAVIGTTPGGHGEMISDGENGFLVPAGDVARLTAAMQILIDDDDLRQRMAVRSLDLSQAFTEASALPLLRALYADVLATSP